MFSKNHSHIWNAPSLRTRLQDCYNSGAKNPIEIKNIFICFGCKLYFRNDRYPHSCPNKAKTLTFIKKILDVSVIKPEPQVVPIPQIAPEPPANPVEMEKLKKDYEKLKKKLEILESDINLANTKSEKADDILDALKFVLKFIKSVNPETHETIMDNLDEEMLKLIEPLAHQ
jgi:hypothetical protein